MHNNPGSSADIIDVMQQLGDTLSASELIAARELGAEYVLLYSPDKVN
jgi:hypothetical protein